MVLGAWAAALVGAVVLGACAVVPVDKTLVMVAQEPQHGMPHGLPLAQPGQPWHRSHRREGEKRPLTLREKPAVVSAQHNRL